VIHHPTGLVRAPFLLIVADMFERGDGDYRLESFFRLELQDVDIDNPRTCFVLVDDGVIAQSAIMAQNVSDFQGSARFLSAKPIKRNRQFDRTFVAPCRVVGMHKVPVGDTIDPELLHAHRTTGYPGKKGQDRKGEVFQSPSSAFCSTAGTSAGLLFP